MSHKCRLRSYKNIGEDGKWAADRIEQLVKQRDELLAALEQIASGEDDNGSILSGGECQRIAYDAIANIKESK